jgi:putative hemolysin
MSPEILVIAFLLLLNGFFALAEIAIVSASKPLLQDYAKQGKRSAIVALGLKENPGRFLSTVQVGITLVGIVAGAYGGASIAQKLTEPFNAIPLINPYGETAAVILIVTCITYFSVVIGELVPKQIALNNAEKFAMHVARPMYILAALCTPIVVILEMSAKILMKLMGVKIEDQGVTEKEIKAVIAEGVSSGAIDDDEEDLMRRIIRLGDRTVKSIMTHRTDVQFIDIDDTINDVRQKINEAGHSRYPVIDKDTTKILGVVKTKEMMANGASDADFRVKDYLRDITVMNENTPCFEALDKFRTQRTHMAAVLDEYGTFEGIFTTSDLLEAIVGVIPSNYDQDDAPHIIQRQDSSWLVDGLTPIDEIHVAIGLDEIITGETYQTIAGFMLAQLKTSPKPGGELQHGQYKFEIMDMDRHRIDKVLITRV